MGAIERFDYDPKKGRFRDWLRTVTLNEICRHWKQSSRRRTRGEFACGDGENDLHTIADASDLDWTRIYESQLLVKAIERVRERGEFNEKEWCVFEVVAYRVDQGSGQKVLVHVDAPQHTRVATEMGVPVAQVYKIKCEIMKRLKDEVLYLADELVLLT
jgi:RNA polymerase sigma-70 factor (ECF subfamily)